MAPQQVKSRTKFYVLLECIANMSMVSVYRAHTRMISLLGLKGGQRSLTMKNHSNTIVTEISLLMVWKKSRLDIMTADFDSAQICSWPHFFLIESTDDERPL